MTRNICLNIIFGLLCFFKSAVADDLDLKLKSKVELRNWTLNSKAYKQETFLQGASIELNNATGVISKTVSDKDGNFEINIPPSGNYTLTITCPGYNPKKFMVSAKTIPVKSNDVNFIPSVNMMGFIGSKTIKGVGDLGLNQPFIKAENNANKYEVDKNGKVTYRGLNMAVNIIDGEYRIIQQFCTCNKLGDLAMERKNYALAKIYYSMAMDIIPGEIYPKERIKKAEDELKLEKVSAVKNRKDIAKKSKSKTKDSVSKQTLVPNPVKKSELRSTPETGNATHKTLQKLGK